MYIYLAFALVGGFYLLIKIQSMRIYEKLLAHHFWPLEFPTLLVRFLGIITLVTSQTLFPSFQFVGSHPVWIWIGGVLGGIF